LNRDKIYVDGNRHKRTLVHKLRFILRLNLIVYYLTWL